MGWVYIDDRFPEHPKTLAAGDDGAWLFVCGIAYTNRGTSDGYIPKSVVPRLTGLKSPTKVARRLVEVGLWHDVGDGYQIHDYEVWNADAMARREKARKAANTRWSKQPPSNAPPPDPSNAQAPPEHVPKDEASICGSSASAMQNPKPQALNPSSSSTAVTQDGPKPCQDDEDASQQLPNRRLFASAIDLITDRRMATSHVGIHNPAGYRVVVRAQASGQYKHTIAGLDLATFATPKALADHLEPPPAPHPLDRQADANRARYLDNERRREHPCPACDGTRFVVVDDGVSTCIDCRGTGALA